MVVDGRVEFEILHIDTGSAQIGICLPNSFELRRAELASLDQDATVDSSVGDDCQPQWVSWPESTVYLQHPKELSQLPNPFVAIDD